jgi:hypothetical protein
MIVGVAAADNLNHVKQSRTNITLVAERPEMSEEERAAGLRELAELIVDPNWLDRETLANIEQLTEPKQ